MPFLQLNNITKSLSNVILLKALVIMPESVSVRIRRTRTNEKLFLDAELRTATLFFFNGSS